MVDPPGSRQEIERQLLCLFGRLHYFGSWLGSNLPATCFPFFNESTKSTDTFFVRLIAPHMNKIGNPFIREIPPHQQHHSIGHARNTSTKRSPSGYLKGEISHQRQRLALVENSRSVSNKHVNDFLGATFNTTEHRFD